MKRIIAILSLLLVALPWQASAEVPERLHYQGYLTDAEGAPVQWGGNTGPARINRQPK